MSSLQTSSTQSLKKEVPSWRNFVPPPAKLTDEEARKIFDETVRRHDYITGSNKMDTPIEGQVFGAISFLPAPGAMPDKDGYFGFAILRGNKPNETSMIDHCVEVIHNDQLSPMQIVRVGRPFPIVGPSYKFPAELTKEINVTAESARVYRAVAKQKLKTDRDAENELAVRREALQEEVDRVDDFDDYLTLRGKLAAVANDLENVRRQEKLLVEIIVKNHRLRLEWDQRKPDYQTTFLKAIQDREAKVGIVKNLSEEMDRHVERRQDMLCNYDKFLVNDDCLVCSNKLNNQLEVVTREASMLAAEVERD